MSLQIWLPLNAGTIKDQGLTPAHPVNHGAVVNNDDGKVGISSYQFGTDSSYISLSPETMHDFQECTLSFWIKILSWNTQYATYFQAGLGSTPWLHYIFGVLRNNYNSNLCFTIADASSASKANFTTPDLELETWYHLTFTYKAGQCSIYVNGTLYKNYSTTIVPNFEGIKYITIGKLSNSSAYQTHCLMNDVRIYNHCLSTKEIKELSKGLILHYKFLIVDTDFSNKFRLQKSKTTNLPIIPNNSEYNLYSMTLTHKNMGIPVSPKYLKGTYLRADRGAIGAVPNIVKPTEQITISLWVELNTPTTQEYPIFNCWENGGVGIAGARDGQYSFVFYANESYHRLYVKPESQSTMWNHIVGTYDGRYGKIYLNGELQDTLDLGDKYPITYHPTAPWGIKNNPGGSWAGEIQENGVSLSDLRIYSTALTEEDILELYQTAASVDDHGNMYAYEWIDWDHTTSLSKQGAWFSNNLQESSVDTTIYTTSDGAKWIKVFHQKNPANKTLFSKEDDFTQRLVKDADTWFNIDLCNKVTTWELMVKQKPEEDSTEEIYRWEQPENPMIATASQVSASKIIRNTDEGYDIGSYGGIYKAGSNISSYLIGKSVWWGAFGVTYHYHGGIPGWEDKVITTGYMDLYLRIDNTTLLNASVAQDNITSPQFIEY